MILMDGLYNDISMHKISIFRFICGINKEKCENRKKWKQHMRTMGSYEVCQSSHDREIEGEKEKKGL